MAIDPPRPKQLPLNALRAFEAAARLGGFADAAGELGVTPGAVSAHVKSIETALQAQLFTRSARQVELTEIGARVLPELTAAFDALGRAMQTLQAEAAPQRVHIAALPSVAQLWLSPRLPQLRASAPEIRISITAMEVPPNLKRTPYDLCLFFGTDGGTVVAKDRIFPVCSPVVAESLSKPEDLLHVPCLSDTTWRRDWQVWAEMAMPGRAFVPTGPVYSLYTLAVEETVNGAGVLMGHEALLARHLAQGNLVAPFAETVPSEQSLRMWSPRPIRQGTPVARVFQWLGTDG